MATTDRCTSVATFRVCVCVCACIRPRAYVYMKARMCRCRSSVAAESVLVSDT